MWPVASPFFFDSCCEQRMISDLDHKLYIIIGLVIAAGCMVAGWILHLKYDFNYAGALFFSLAIVVPEYLINTYYTRLSKKKRIFNVAQLGAISTVAGVAWTIFFALFVFKDHLNWTDFLGFVLVAIGTGLLLWDRKIVETDVAI